MLPQQELSKLPQYEFLKIISHSPHVAQVSLNRPTKRNALHMPLWEQLRDCFRRLAADPNLRCVVLSGEGAMFCAGIDVAMLASQPKLDTKDVARIGMRFRQDLRKLQECVLALSELPVPIIAAIHGQCVGGGCDIASFCDIRWSDPNTTFSIREVVMGLTADLGNLQRLPRLVGNDSLFREVCYTGRDFTAQEALTMGMITRVTDNVVAEAVQLALTVAGRSPVAVAGIKEMLNHPHRAPVADAMNYIQALNAYLLQTEDLKRSIEASLTKRTPTFSKL